MNINCVICSDLLVAADSVFTTPCGHIFHHVCLLQWMERSKSCPQCRNKCTERNIFRVYFNNVVNLDSTQNTVNLVESVDNLTLQIREKDQTLKELREQKLKLEDTSKAKEKKIEKLETSMSRSLQIIATMRHEMDILSSHRASYKTIENENAELKSRLDLMVTVETVLTASQLEVDEILKQKINTKDLAVMVGTLKRELNNNELRKNEMRKQLQMIKYDLKVEQENRRELQDKLSCYESENHALKTQLGKLNKYETAEEVDIDLTIDTPKGVKRPRLAPKVINDLNTSAPLSQNDLQKRVAEVQTSDSPYLRVKSSSIALACVLKKPMQMKAVGLMKSKSFDISRDKMVPSFSIFKNPRVPSSASIPTLNSEHHVYNGIGGTTKVLQSDLKADNHANWTSIRKPTNGIKKKKLSPTAFNI